jgi:hypothetical protein
VVNRIILIAALMALLTSCGNLFSSDRSILSGLFASQDTQDLEITIDSSILGPTQTDSTISAVKAKGFISRFLRNQLIFTVGLEPSKANENIARIQCDYGFKLINDGTLPAPPPEIKNPRPSTGRSDFAVFEVVAASTGLSVLKSRLSQLGIRGKIVISSEQVADFLNAISVVHGDTITLNTLSELN